MWLSIKHDRFSATLTVRRALKRPMRLGFGGFVIAATLHLVLIGASAAGVHAWDGETSARGMVRAVNQSALAIEFAMRVEKLHVREAHAFRKGDPLVSFDCARLRAEQAASEASHKEARLQFESQVYLDRKGATGRIDVEVARARAERAGAEAEALNSRLRQCRILAPFDGRVVELAVAEHEIPTPGKAFMSIIDETRFEIDLILPSQSLRHLRIGQAFQFRVEETGTNHAARVDRLGAAVDPVSQTLKVIGVFEDLPAGVLAGMSGSADFQYSGAAR